MSTAVRPVATAAPEIFANQNAVRYGVLMGGAKEIQWDGIGDASIGHLTLPRRLLAEFTRIQVGRRNEMDSSLDENQRLTGLWEHNTDRVIPKTPSQCIGAVLENYANRGFTGLNSLTGVDFEVAEQFFAQVMPEDVLVKPLVDVIEHLSSTSHAGVAEQLRLEMLSGALTAKAYISDYISAVKGEREKALASGMGKRKLDDLDREYFWELQETLPEDAPAKATLSLGKEIAAAMGGSSSKSDDILSALVEQNRLQAEANKLLLDKLSAQMGTSEAPKKAKEKG